MKIALRLVAVTALVIIGGASGVVLNKYTERRMAGENVTVQQQISDCINQGSGVVKTLANDAFLVIKETEFVEGQTITNPASGKKWVIMSDSHLDELLKNAWDKGAKGEPLK